MNQASASDNTEVTSTQNEYFLGNNDKSNDSNITTNINGYTNQNGTWKNTSSQNANGWQTAGNDWYHFNNGNQNKDWQNIDNNWYYMNPETAVLESGIQKINNNFYYLNDKADGTFGAMKTGWQYVDGHWYGFKGDGSAYLGWQNLGGNTYYFKPENAQMATGDTLISGNYYYFDPASGHQLKGMLVDANTKLLKYYDPSTGIRQTELTVKGHTYKFNPLTGVIDTTILNDGLNQIAGHVYYYNQSANSFAFNSWQKLNGAWYYFDLTNAWADTGYHIINGIEYYFDPVNANLYQNRWVNVNGWTYHADNSGRLWFPQWYSQFPVGEGCSVYSLAMMLSPKEYINMGYEVNLLQYRQAGNVYNGVGFYLIIQPDSLVELAHHFDSSVRNISGSSVRQIIDTINSGRPVLYYGYSRYERSYAHHNHAKVIVGYQNGWFRIFDPCYSYASQGSFGWNAFDYGAKSWITVSQFAREYAGQAITVD
ncbi:C39 family peptidase [Limosilactobacillus agrestimuris]|uniref:C39 family peptidase n=1 Tax=Limosilactobacillus agrestimuris TaxID=2941331 RepID=UPI002041E7D0|nr:C39 family peptidase [Limosilactobacillus agrestimuris]